MTSFATTYPNLAKAMLTNHTLYRHSHYTKEQDKEAVALLNNITISCHVTIVQLIDRLFIWGATPQGAKFWNQLYDTLIYNPSFVECRNALDQCESELANGTTFVSSVTIQDITL